MVNPFCFRPDTFKYFGCVPIQVALGIAFFISVATQYYVSIFFLIQHVWFWFIALFVALGMHSLLFWAVYSKKGILFYPLMVYEILFILLMIGSAVWMVITLTSPRGSMIYSHCLDRDYSKEDDCYWQTQTLAGINMGVFFVCAILNIFVFDVFYRFRIYLTAGNERNRRPAVNVVSNEDLRCPRRPTYDDPTHNVIYSPGNAYQPQPLHTPTSPATPGNPPGAQNAYNPSYQPYPTVRGPTAPVYSSSRLETLYDAPPAYSQAVSEDKY